MKEVISFKHVKEDNRIEVIWREPSNLIHPTDPPISVPDKVWTEVYGVKDGVITLIQTVYGTHEPAKYVPENITFPTEKEKKSFKWLNKVWGK